MLIILLALGGGLLVSRLSIYTSLNLGVLFLVRTRIATDLTAQPAAIGWLSRVAENEMNPFSDNATAHIWALFASQGNCKSAIPWGEKLLLQSQSESILRLRAHGSMMSRLCLWTLYQRTDRQSQAKALQDQLRFFDVQLLESRLFRQEAIAIAPRFVQEGIWPLDLAERVFSYALGVPEDILRVQTALRELVGIYPKDAGLRYLIAVSEMADGSHSEAIRDFRMAQSLSPGEYPDCAIELTPTPPVSPATSAYLWSDAFDSGLTKWEFNTGWVGGEHFWPGLFAWEHDRAIYAEGTASLRVSGIWIEPDNNRESARAGMIVRLPDLPSGHLLVRFYYRTELEPESFAQILWNRSDTIYVRWDLPATSGCWRQFESVLDWVPDPRSELIVLMDGVGDVWIDALSVERIAP